MIKWILVDQAEVMVHSLFTDPAGYTIQGSQFEAALLFKIFSSELHDRYTLGRVSEREYVQAFINEERLNIDAASLIEIVRNDVRPIKGMKELLLQLRKRYMLCAVINEGKEWAHVKLRGFENLFQQVFISAEMGVMKPDPNFFRCVLERVDADPSVCLFIDDNSDNIKSAQALGIQSIQFKGLEQLRTSLDELGLL